MVALKSPLIGMQMDEEASQYVAVLERRMAALTINEIKFMALLEISTGEKWDTLHVDFEEGNLDIIAIKVIQKRMSVDEMAARRLLAQYKRETGDKNLTVAQQDAVDNNPQTAG